jgi:hypothetical protein
MMLDQSIWPRWNPIRADWFLARSGLRPSRDNWQDDLEETPTSASFAEQPAPAPVSAAHDDTDAVVDRMIAEDGYRVASAMTGSLIDKIMAATSPAEAVP